jgi:molecular chaperone DnaJ
MANRDYYQILGVTSDVTEQDLKKAWQKKARELHPDRNQDPAAADKMKEVNEAYQVLSDRKKRAEYDYQLQHGGTAGGSPDFGSMRDVFNDHLGNIFGDLFGGGRTSRSGSHSQRGSDLKYNLSLNLEDAVFGSSTTIKIPGLGRCQICNGLGTRKGTTTTTCPTCEGAGQVYLQHGPFSIQQTCPDCQGQGRTIPYPCPSCFGQGQVRETRTLSVRIPAGVDDGDRIRVTGEGEAGVRGGQAGDLYVQIQLKPHELFKRKGRDLYCEVPIFYSTAVLGGSVKVPTLGGEVNIKVPRGTQSGTILRIPSKGIPGTRGSRAGDLFCALVVETSVHLSSHQEELLLSYENSLNLASSKYYPRYHSWFEKMHRFFTRQSSESS